MAKCMSFQIDRAKRFSNSQRCDRWFRRSPHVLAAAFFLASSVVATASRAADEVTVKPLQGEAVQGRLIELNEKQIKLEAAGGDRVFEAKAVHSVRTSDTAKAAEADSPSELQVELIDESTFRAESFSFAQATATIRELGGKEFNLPSRIVKSLRFHKQDEALKTQWDEIASGKRAGDVLVVRKVREADDDAGQAGSIVLDQLEGIVREIGESSVTFEFDGEPLEVSQTKLQGILFRQQNAGELPNPLCRMRDATGGIWQLREISLKDGQFTYTTVAGAQREVPAGNWIEIDFSAGNLAYLSDLEPETMNWRPYFQSLATPASLKKWFEPKRDQGADGLPITLNGESFDKGLALHSRTVLTYRLTKDYRRLTAVVGVDERFRGTANLTFAVYGDDRPLFSKAIKGSDPPIPLDLDVKGVRRLRIEVDFGSDRSDVGDLLYLGDAKLVK